MMIRVVHDKQNNIQLSSFISLDEIEKCQKCQMWYNNVRSIVP